MAVQQSSRLPDAHLPLRVIDVGVKTFRHAELKASLGAMHGGTVDCVVPILVSLLSTPVLEHAIVVVLVRGPEEVRHLELVQNVLRHKHPPGALDLDRIVSVDPYDVNSSTSKIAADAGLKEYSGLPKATGVQEALQ